MDEIELKNEEFVEFGYNTISKMEEYYDYLVDGLHLQTGEFQEPMSEREKREFDRIMSKPDSFISSLSKILLKFHDEYVSEINNESILGLNIIGELFTTDREKSGHIRSILVKLFGESTTDYTIGKESKRIILLGEILNVVKNNTPLETIVGRFKEEYLSSKLDIKVAMQYARQVYLRTELNKKQALEVSVEILTETHPSGEPLGDSVMKISEFLDRVEIQVSSREPEIRKIVNDPAWRKMPYRIIPTAKDLEIIRLQDLKPLSPPGSDPDCPF